MADAEWCTLLGSLDSALYLSPKEHSRKVPREYPELKSIRRTHLAKNIQILFFFSRQFYFSNIIYNRCAPHPPHIISVVYSSTNDIIIVPPEVMHPETPWHRRLVFSWHRRLVFSWHRRIVFSFKV